MGVTEAQRLQVFEQARERWGEGPAEALMAVLPPASDRVATQRDLRPMATKAFVLGVMLAHLAGVYAGLLGLAVALGR
jgi:hypothetical protein